MLYDVFLSHSMGEDQALAEQLREALESNGLRCWLAEKDLQSSDRFPAALADALDDSRLVLLVFTAVCNNSPWIERELLRAINNHVPILPVRFTGIAPSRTIQVLVGAHNWFDAASGSPIQHFPRIAQTVLAVLPRPSSDDRRTVVPADLEATAQNCLAFAVRYVGIEHGRPEQTAEEIRNALGWIAESIEKRDERGRLRCQLTVTDALGVRLFHVDPVLIGQRLDIAVQHECFRKPEGRFLDASEQVGRRTLWLYRRLPLFPSGIDDWYLFVEAHWYVGEQQ